MAQDPGPENWLPPLYPADHTFVIALRRDADVQGGQFVGRVEHLSSGRTVSFSDFSVLVEFMRCATETEKPGSE